MRMTHRPRQPRRARPAGDQPRRPRQGDGPPARAAPAVAGRDDRPDQRRRARADRRGRPLPAVDGRALRRVRPPPRAGRDARRAARPRLGAALAAPHAPRPRRRPSPGCATTWRASPRRTRSPRRWRSRPRSTPRCSTRCGRSTSAPIRQLDATGEDGTPLLELCIDPDEGPDVAARARRAAAPARAAPSWNCPSASARSWRSTTRKR